MPGIATMENAPFQASHNPQPWIKHPKLPPLHTSAFSKEPQLLHHSFGCPEAAVLSKMDKTDTFGTSTTTPQPP